MEQRNKWYRKSTLYDNSIRLVFELTDKNGRKIWNNVYEILYIDFIKGSSITSPSYLLHQQAILSTSNQTMLIMQKNGDLTLYQNPEDLHWSTGYQSRYILWHSNTYNSPDAYLEVQSDGNSVVYNSNDNLQWSTTTSGIGTAPYTLTVHDFYFELTDKDGRAIWNSMYGVVYINFLSGHSIVSLSYLLPQQAVLSSSNNTMLIMQNSGNLVLYRNPENQQWSTGYQSLNALWYSNTNNNPNAYLAVQNNGDLVVYNSNGNQQWDSNTKGMGIMPYTLTVYDLYIELTDSNNTKIWNSN